MRNSGAARTHTHTHRNETDCSGHASGAPVTICTQHLSGDQPRAHAHPTRRLPPATCPLPLSAARRHDGDPRHRDASIGLATAICGWPGAPTTPRAPRRCIAPAGPRQGAPAATSPASRVALSAPAGRQRASPPWGRAGDQKPPSCADGLLISARRLTISDHVQASLEARPPGLHSSGSKGQVGGNGAQRSSRAERTSCK